MEVEFDMIHRPGLGILFGTTICQVADHKEERTDGLLPPKQLAPAHRKVAADPSRHDITVVVFDRSPPAGSFCAATLGIHRIRQVIENHTRE